MSDGIGTLLTLAGYFALLSLFAIGGANAAMPEMHRLAVEVMHWMTDRQFADMYAIAQVSPGPNVIVVTLIGYHVAGLAGRAGGHAGDVRPDLRVCVLRRPHLGPLQGRALAHGDPGRPGAGVARADRGQRRGGHAGGGAKSWVTVAITVVAALVTYTIRVNPLWVFAGRARCSAWRDRC